MIYDLHSAVPLLRPNAQYIFEGEKYSGLQWLDNIQSKPTLEELQNKVDELNSIEPMRLLRIERNKRLSEIDWVTIKYNSQNLPIPKGWSDYTQSLRDITITCRNPSCMPDGRLDMSSVNWPIMPSNTN